MRLVNCEKRDGDLAEPFEGVLAGEALGGEIKEAIVSLTGATD